MIIIWFLRYILVAFLEYKIFWTSSITSRSSLIQTSYINQFILSSIYIFFLSYLVFFSYFFILLVFLLFLFFLFFIMVSKKIKLLQELFFSQKYTLKWLRGYIFLFFSHVIKNCTEMYKIKRITMK